MNIWLKELSEHDDKKYYDVLIELSSYTDVYAKPLPDTDMSYEEFADFKKVRLKLKNGIDLPKNVVPMTTYWVMNDEEVIGYATLKHVVSLDKPGGHFGCCLLKEFQNKGIGSIVANLLSKIAYEELGIDEVIYTSKIQNIQSQKSVNHIGGTLIKVENGYHYYSVDLRKLFSEERKR